MSESIVLTGATGNTGEVIATLLKQRGVPFVALAHSAKRQAQLEGAGIRSVVGDFDDPASLERALAGADKAYLVCTPDEKLIQRETAFIRAAQKVGVRHIVKCSAYLAGLDAETQNLRSHGVIEQALIESGLDYTIIRPHGFMQTFTLFAWDMIEKAHVIALPGGEGKLPLVDVRNVAQIAVKALTEPGHAGKAYDVTGPEALSFYDVAAILQRVLGHPVTYLPGKEAQLKMVMSVLGVPPTPTEHTLKIFRMQREGRIDRVHTTVQDLGLQPITYDQFVRDLVAGRTGGGNSFQPPDTLLVRLLNASMPVMLKLQLRISGAVAPK
jgi:uncharacterized protein YbjT (DUF2867 family)